jgi:hypothetical protein
MPAYRFSIKTVVEIEELGIMALPDDAEAFAFGLRIIQDMTCEDQVQYKGCSMDLTEGKRSVGCLSFPADPSSPD